jgi:O-acetyl-ADP-ribose deacetylase (regulator of RNase III)
MKKYLAITLLLSFGINQSALAAWWNPFSWFSGRTRTVEDFNRKNRVQGEIDGTKIMSEVGGIQTYKVGAIITPLGASGQTDGLSYYIETEGRNQNAFRLFNDQIKAQGGFPAKMGTVAIHPSGGSAEYIIPVIVLGGHQQESFRLIRDSIYQGLVLAHWNNVKTVAIPAMGNGVSGNLTEKQSAAAILAGIAMATKVGAKFEQIILPVYRELELLKEYRTMLDPKIAEYKNYMPGGNLSPESGKVHYDWAETGSGFGSGIRLSNLGSIDRFEVRTAAQLGGSTQVIPVFSVDKIPVGALRSADSERVYVNTVRTPNRNFQSGFSETDTVYFLADKFANMGSREKAAEAMVYEIVKASGQRSLSFTFNSSFLGIETKGRLVKLAIADGTMNAIHRLKSEGVKVYSISIAIDPKTEDAATAKVAFKHVADEYARQNFELFGEEKPGAISAPHGAMSCQSLFAG